MHRLRSDKSWTVSDTLSNSDLSTNQSRALIQLEGERGTQEFAWRLCTLSSRLVNGLSFALGVLLTYQRPICNRSRSPFENFSAIWEGDREKVWNLFLVSDLSWAPVKGILKHNRTALAVGGYLRLRANISNFQERGVTSWNACSALLL